MSHGHGGFHGHWHDHHWGWQEGALAQEQAALGLLSLESLFIRGFGQHGQPGAAQHQDTGTARQVAENPAPATAQQPG
jgi:hypothetical protein